MKKAIALAMASVMAAGLLAGCGGSAANSTAASWLPLPFPLLLWL